MTMFITGVGEPGPGNEAWKPIAYHFGVGCQHGWRNLINNEFERPVNAVIGGQRADYPGAGFATLKTARKIIQTLYETGQLDSSVGWDNPPP